MSPQHAALLSNVSVYCVLHPRAADTEQPPGIRNAKVAKPFLTAPGNPRPFRNPLLARWSGEDIISLVMYQLSRSAISTDSRYKISVTKQGSVDRNHLNRTRQPSPRARLGSERNGESTDATLLKCQETCAQSDMPNA